MSYNMLAELGDWKVHRYLRELNLRALNQIEITLKPTSTSRSLPKYAKSLIHYFVSIPSREDKSIRFCPSIVPSSSIYIITLFESSLAMLCDTKAETISAMWAVV